VKALIFILWLTVSLGQRGLGFWLIHEAQKPKNFGASTGNLLTLGIVTVVVLMFFLGNIVKAGVNSFGPKITGTNVVLSGATVSPLTLQRHAHRADRRQSAGLEKGPRFRAG